MHVFYFVWWNGSAHNWIPISVSATSLLWHVAPAEVHAEALALHRRTDGKGKGISSSLFTPAAQGGMKTVSRKVLVWLFQLSAELLLFSWTHLTDPLTDQLWLFGLVYLADIFLTMDTVSLSLQGEQGEVFVANNKIWTLKWKNCGQLPNTSKNSSNVMSGDIKKCDFLLL